MIDLKVGYHTLSGGISTAYLDSSNGEDFYTGVNKYSDEPVTVYWTGTDWIEIEEGDYE